MVLSEVVNTQYAFPIGVVLICAILVFVFGFKSAEQPDFDQLTYIGDDRKPAGKKRKLKDKKTQSNGHATSVSESNAEVKTNSSKTVGKAEKSPLKEVSNKVVTKQPKKQEASPVKDKPVLKNKDNKKELESTPKKLKEKKQIVEKSPVKDNKNAIAKPKGKGKENHVEEIKNKKNEKNLAKLKAETTPAGDDGGWKQVLSSKDKKNRKKDEPEMDEIIAEKNAPKLEGTPKAKKGKNIDLVMVKIPVTKENKDVEEAKEAEEEPKVIEKVKKVDKSVVKKVEDVEKKADKITEKKKSEKQSEKKKKVEKESKGEKEVDEKANLVAEAKVVEEIKTSVELSPETVAKTKKKNKKKPDNKKEATMEVVKDEVVVKQPAESVAKLDAKAMAIPVKPTEAAVPETTIDLTAAVVFDELGDTWKEAKVPKKNKKKVRKDQ